VAGAASHRCAEVRTFRRHALAHAQRVVLARQACRVAERVWSRDDAMTGSPATGSALSWPLCEGRLALSRRGLPGPR
jgi:hypothetical protein